MMAWRPWPDWHSRGMHGCQIVFGNTAEHKWKSRQFLPLLFPRRVKNSLEVHSIPLACIQVRTMSSLLVTAWLLVGSRAATKVSIGYVELANKRHHNVSCHVLRSTCTWPACGSQYIVYMDLDYIYLIIVLSCPCYLSTWSSVIVNTHFRYEA